MSDKLLDKKNSDFPKQLIEIRASLKLSTEKFALKCGLSKTCIRRMEQPQLFEYKVVRDETYDKVKTFLTSIDYFNPEVTDKTSLMKDKVIKVAPYTGPYKSIWQPIAAHIH